MNETRYCTLTTYVSHKSTHDTLETLLPTIYTSQTQETAPTIYLYRANSKRTRQCR